MAPLPSVCVIGAGSSGIAAAKALHAARLRLRLLRGVRPRRRQLGLQEPQRDVVGVPLAAHQHVARADGVRRLPDAEVVSRLPAPHAHRARTSTPTSTTSASATGSRSRRASSARSRAADGGWDVTLGRGETRTLRRADRRQRPPLGPALARAGVPGRTTCFAGVQMHSHDYTGEDPELLPRQARRRARHGQLGDGHRGRGVVQPRRAVYLAARRGAWVIPKYLFGRPLDTLDTRARIPFAVAPGASQGRCCG